MSPPPTLTFDPETYAHHLAALDLTAEQSDEMIRVIANIMLAFVDLGFGISSTQTPCGEDDILGELIPQALPDLLNSSHSDIEERHAPEAPSLSAEREES